MADKTKFKQIAAEVKIERIDDILAAIRTKLLSGDFGGASDDLQSVVNDLNALGRAVEASEKKQ